MKILPLSIIILFSILSVFFYSGVSLTIIIPRQTKQYFNWGNKSTLILLSQYGKRKDIVMVNLHDNESTSVEAAKKILERTGGILIEIENDGKRLIDFDQNGRWFQFDPNRIFTQNGLERNLRELNGPVPKSARNSVTAFSRFILQQIPNSAAIRMALHNNEDGDYSVDSYKQRGIHSRDASKIHINRVLDPDNFLIVNTNSLFNRLTLKGYNIVLQDNLRARDDGSLSIYFGQRKIPYVNVEAQHGQTKEQSEMVEAVIKNVGKS